MDGEMMRDFSGNSAPGYEDVKMVDGGWKALKDSGIKTQFLASKPEPAEVKNR